MATAGTPEEKLEALQNIAFASVDKVIEETLDSVITKLEIEHEQLNSRSTPAHKGVLMAYTCDTCHAQHTYPASRPDGGSTRWAHIANSTWEPFPAQMHQYGDRCLCG